MPIDVFDGLAKKYLKDEYDPIVASTWVLSQAIIENRNIFTKFELFEFILRRLEESKIDGRREKG